ncbi:MAG: hypothetical protein HW402_575 [Dehalococcoidales bacterium]|nr:hypothetical protein [Dehalococcoidales bacterium]
MKVDFAKLSRAFNPQCVVVVGDKRENDFIWLRAQSTFKGKLYSVQVSPDDIAGIKALGVANYTSLSDVPEAVDLAIVAVPRAVAPRILEDCIRKEVAGAYFYTSGFSETGTEEGLKMERLLTKRAEETNFHLIGPNCMGIFNPKIGIRQNAMQYTGVAGTVGFISQSGNNAITFAREGHLQGLDINKSVSFGNGIVLESTDYLEYFGGDPEIKAIGMYVEGVKNGRRFLSVLREVSARKPVVIWKGGRTAEGGRAIASHTGSLAIPRAIWDAAINQHGGVRVAGAEELIDTLKALLLLAPVYSDRVAIAGGSGGQSVAIADVFAEAGLRVPLLTQQSYDEFATFFTLIGGSYRNPVDTGNPNRKQMKRIMGILDSDANVDNLALLMMPRIMTTEQFQDNIDLLTGIKRSSAKPVMAILAPSFSPEEVAQAQEMMRRFQDGGVPVFPNYERGARALRNARDYYRVKNGDSVS